MVRDGYFYGIGSLLAAGVIAWLAAWPYAVPVLLLAAFLSVVFRDPERQIPKTNGAVVPIVSPGDGKVTDVSVVTAGGASSRNRISIFLSVFDVHVNRSPIAGVIREVRYQRGKFLNAMSSAFGGRE
jgi:phosphatidylserine decarboxylase